MNVKLEIEKHASDENKHILRWLWEYGSEVPWSTAAYSTDEKTPAYVRVWALTAAGRMLYEHVGKYSKHREDVERSIVKQKQDPKEAPIRPKAIVVSLNGDPAIEALTAEMDLQSAVMLLLKGERVKAGISQAEMAEKLDTVQSVIAKTGTKESKVLTIEDLRKYCKVLGLEVSIVLEPAGNK